MRSGNTEHKGRDRMSHYKTIRMTLLCVGVLTVLYGLAHFDRPHRKMIEDTTAMAENETNEPVMAEQKIMYLTFNDAPSQYTQGVLEVLDRYHIKASFFVSGENPKYFDLLKTIHREGHTLALHTYSHDEAVIYADPDAYFQDLVKLENLLYEQTGVKTDILRFPGGSAHAEAMAKLIPFAKYHGYRYVDWNADNGDRDASLSPDDLYQNTLAGIQNKKTVMMLMHNGENSGNTLQALDRTIQELMRQGWEFRTIDSSTPIFHLLDE